LRRSLKAGTSARPLSARAYGNEDRDVPEQRETAIAFGPVGIAGWLTLVLGVVLRRRLVAVVGLTAVVADVTVAEFDGFKARHESSPGQ
jgi:hypothetical protein